MSMEAEEMSTDSELSVEVEEPRDDESASPNPKMNQEEINAEPTLQLSKNCAPTDDNLM